jgi:Bacterial Ig domain
VRVNARPEIVITAPGDGAVFVPGDAVVLSGTATDAEDGNLGGSIQWISNKDGSLHTGASFSTSGLSVNTHTITAQATDSGGKTGSAVVHVTINQAVAGSVHVASVVTGTVNANRGAKYGTATVTIVNNLGQPVSGYMVSGDFGGSFNESATGGPTNSNGQATLQTTGTQKGPTVTFCVSNVTGTLPYVWTDSAPGTACGAPPPPQAPVVTITSPADGSTFALGSNIVFTGTADDFEQGDLSASIVWTLESLNGTQFGTGFTANTSSLPLGDHTIFAKATDGSSMTGSDSITVHVIDTPPSLTMHVGDLDGSGTSSSPSRWNATVTVTVHSADHAVVSGATVSGSWSNGANGSGGCTTTANGQCSFSKNNIKTNVSGVTYTVTSVTRTGDSYSQSANHDPDGDSNGTTIAVYRP